jgi:hypothetical protein
MSWTPAGDELARASLCSPAPAVTLTGQPLLVAFHVFPYFPQTSFPFSIGVITSEKKNIPQPKISWHILLTI